MTMSCIAAITNYGVSTVRKAIRMVSNSDNPPEDDEDANKLRLELIRYLTVVAPIPEQIGRHGF